MIGVTFVRAPLRNLRQPWLFIYYAVGFGVVGYLISNESISGALVAGLLFATLMSLFTRWRARRGRLE